MDMKKGKVWEMNNNDHCEREKAATNPVRMMTTTMGPGRGQGTQIGRTLTILLSSHYRYYNDSQYNYRVGLGAPCSSVHSLHPSTISPHIGTFFVSTESFDCDPRPPLPFGLGGWHSARLS